MRLEDHVPARPYRQSRQSRQSKRRRQRGYELLDSGQPVRSVAKALGVCSSTVSYWKRGAERSVAVPTSATWPPPWIRKPPDKRSLEGRRKLDSAQAVSRFARRPRDAGTPPPSQSTRPTDLPSLAPPAGRHRSTTSGTPVSGRRRTPAGRTRRTRLMGARRVLCAHHASHACTAACPERLQHR